jgi:adenylate kinase
VGSSPANNPQVRRLILLGPPASGKGTLGAALARELGVPAVSTGAVLRREKEKDTEIGREAASYTDRGLYFPDELALRIVDAWLEENPGGFLFDGFPRTLTQARKFEALLQKRNTPLQAALCLLVPASELERRVCDRLTCQVCGKTFSASATGLREGDACDREGCTGTLGRRDDDKLEIFSNRLRQHEELTCPVQEFYRESGLLTEIDGTGTPAEVLARTRTHLGL